MVRRLSRRAPNFAISLKSEVFCFGEVGVSGVGVSRLRPGPQRIGSAEVVAIQRTRILHAMTELTAEYELARITVAQILKGAGVSRRTFYELFADREACLIAACQDALEQATAYVQSAYESTARSGWQARVRSALAALLGFFDEELLLAWLLLVVAPYGGEAVLDLRARSIDVLISVIDEGRHEMPSGRQVPAVTAEGIVGGVLSILHARILARQPLTPLLGELMGVIVLPYVGSAAARQELHNTCPPPPKQASSPVTTALRRLGIRITSRRARVLNALATHPGASNRVLAEASGIADAAQISKLIGLLKTHGLAHNNTRPGPGTPNSWQLTPYGQEIERTIRQHHHTKHGEHERPTH
jgi:AcrR family transcriptional regulator